jgi:ABC-type dipeptide/oligopeptide/nickel transport system permease component
MVNFLLRRLLFMVPTVLGITFMVFMLLALAPGGIGAGLAVQGGQMSDTSRVAQMQAYLEDRYGLSDPVVVQYLRWLGRISPVKFGERDLRNPSGDRVSAPREVRTPEMPWLFTPPGAPSVVFTPVTAEGQQEQQIEEFRKLQREAEGARRSYIGSARLFKDVLAD